MIDATQLELRPVAVRTTGGQDWAKQSSVVGRGTTSREEIYIETAIHRRILNWFRHGCDPSILILLGPAGIGKTFTLRYMRKLFPERSFFIIPATFGQNLEHLFGYWLLDETGKTTFVEGDLLKGLTTPNAVILIDDAMCVAGDLMLLNGLGDSSRTFVCPPLGRTMPIADGVVLVLAANPAPPDLPPWEAQKWEIPVQIRDRAVMIELSEGLALEDERRILEQHWPESHPREVLEGLLEVVHNLRTNGVLYSYTPSIRSLIIAAVLLSDGRSLSEAFREGIGDKYIDPMERAAAREAFDAKFDNSEAGSTTATG